MALKIHVIKREVKAGVDEGKEKYYGQVRLREPILLEKLCERVSANTSATPADVEMVLNGLVDTLAHNLENGNVVRMKELGNFRLTGGSPGVTEEKNFKCWMMRRPKITLSPSAQMRTTLANTRYEWLSTKEVEEECARPHRG